MCAKQRQIEKGIDLMISFADDIDLLLFWQQKIKNDWKNEELGSIKI